MITGYEIGTEVKWNQANSLETGVVEAVYRTPTRVVLNGELVQVEVSDGSPTYLILRYDGQHVLLPHQAVMLKSTNSHT